MTRRVTTALVLVDLTLHHGILAPSPRIELERQPIQHLSPDAPICTIRSI